MNKNFYKIKFLVIIIFLYFADSFGSPTYKSNFLNVTDFIKIKKNNTAKFNTIDNVIIRTKYESIADPAYEQTFKKIFSKGNEIIIDSDKKIDGQKRLKSLLNSLLYPNAGKNGYKIREISYFTNELTSLGQTSQANNIKFDIACECKCWEKSNKEKTEQVLNIEMQTNYDSNFFNRLIKYGSSLKANFGKRTTVLSFLNYRSSTSGEMFALDKKNLETGELVGNTEHLNIYSINLPKFIEKIKNNEKISIYGQEIQEEGKIWLKLLGIRNLNCKCGIRFIVPQIADNLIINSALTILSSFENISLAGYINNTESITGVINTAKNKARKKGIKEGIKQGIMLVIDDYMDENEIDFISAINKLKEKNKYKNNPNFIKTLCSITEDEFNSYKEQQNKKRKLENEATLEHPSKKSKSEKSDK